MTYHEKWCDYPVDKNTEYQLLPHALVADNVVKGLVLHIAQDGIHHDEQPNGCFPTVSESGVSHNIVMKNEF